MKSEKSEVGQTKVRDVINVRALKKYPDCDKRRSNPLIHKIEQKTK